MGLVGERLGVGVDVLGVRGGGRLSLRGTGHLAALLAAVLAAAGGGAWDFSNASAADMAARHGLPGLTRWRSPASGPPGHP